MANELIVRELGSSTVTAGALAAGVTEIQDNVARFFNDTPFNLNLVAVRIGCITGLTSGTADAGTAQQVFGVTEISRQAQAGQQEGIIGNVRSTTTLLTKLDANGGAGSHVTNQGEILLGDFKTPMMTLEVQTNLFMHVIFTALAVSTTTVTAGQMQIAAGVTLYFKKAGRR